VSARPLTPEERDALAFLLTADFPGAEELRAQVPFAEASGRCPCGCATVGLKVDPARAAAANVVERVPVSASSKSGSAGLLLFVADGYLSCLEIYPSDGTPSVFPPPSAFEPPHVTAE
jgi:hypothetical protein